MNKINKIFASVFVASIFFVSLPASVLAEEEEKMPRSPVCEYLVDYNESYTDKNKVYGLTTHTAINDTPTTQSMSISYTRTVTFTGNVSASAERSLIIWKIKGTVEGSYGSTYSETAVTTTNVPGHRTYYCDTGSKFTTTSGTLNYLNTDCSRSSKNARLNFTSGAYARWYQ